MQVKAKLSLGLAFVLSIVSVAGAFGFAPDPFDMHVSDLVILQARSVQNELHITEKQRAQMNVFATEHTNKVKAYEAELRKTKAKMDDHKLIQFVAVLREQVFGVLTPPQLKRLREISLQQAGLIALLDQQVATRIGVTPAQLKSMRAQVSASNKQIQAIEKKASFPVFEQYKDKHVKTKQEAEAMRKEFQGKMAAAAATVRPQIAALVSDERTKLLGSLNQPEINKYKALMGKPFAEKH